jgi:hypothetical protein
LQMNPVLDKIRYLQQQIIDREVIKDDCLIGVPIDNQLKENIKEYNELVSYLKGFFAEEAVRTLIAHLELEIEDELVKNTAVTHTTNFMRRITLTYLRTSGNMLK